MSLNSSVLHLFRGDKTHIMEKLSESQKQDLFLSQSAKTRPGADCGSDHELLIAKSSFKLKEVGKTTRIPYSYTVEVANRFKGLDLVDRVPEELWREVHNIAQKIMTKTIPKKKKSKKAKWLPEEALQIVEE